MRYATLLLFLALGVGLWPREESIFPEDTNFSSFIVSDRGAIFRWTDEAGRGHKLQIGRREFERRAWRVRPEE